MDIEDAGDVCGSKFGVPKTEDWLGCVHYLLMYLCV